MYLFIIHSNHIQRFLLLLLAVLWPFSSTKATSLPIPLTYPQVSLTTAPFGYKQLPIPAYKPTRAPTLRPVARLVRSRQTRPRVAKIVGRGYQCVRLAQLAGFPIHAGYARNWPSAARKLGYKVDKNPTPGSVFVTRESRYRTSSGHVGLILKVEGSWLYVRESNYARLTITEGWMPTSKLVAVIHKK